MNINARMKSELFISNLRVKNLEESLINIKTKVIQKNKGIKSNSDLSSELYMDKEADSQSSLINPPKNKINNQTINQESPDKNMNLTVTSSKVRNTRKRRKTISRINKSKHGKKIK